MDLPYSVDQVYCNAAVEDEYCQTIININTPEGYKMKKGYKPPAEVDINELAVAEIEEPND